MSAFSGPQGKGARQTRRARMRAEAEQIKAQDAAADPNQGDLLGGEQ